MSGPTRPDLADVLGPPGATSAIPVGPSATPGELAALAHVPGGAPAPNAPPAALGQAPNLSAALRDSWQQAGARLNPFAPGAQRSLNPFADVNQAAPRPAAISHHGWGEDRSAPPLVFPGGAAGPGAGAPAYDPLPAGGIAKIGAQNIDLTAPEYQQQMKDALGDTRAALAGKSDILQAAGEAKAGAAVQQAEGVGRERGAIGAVAEQHRKANERADEDIKRLQDERAKLIADLHGARIRDPQADRGYARKAYDAVGGAFGGLAQVFGHLPGNPYLEAMKAAQAQGLDVQKSNLAARRASLGDYTQQLQDALKVRAQQGEVAEQQTNLGLKGAALIPQEAALASQAPVERAEGQVKAADVGVQGAELGVTGAKEAMAEHKYVPAHNVATGPDMVAIRKSAEKIYTDSKQDMTPQEALRQAIILHTGHDITPGAPLQGIAPVAKAGPAAQNEASVNDALSRMSEMGRDAAREVGLGTSIRGAITPGGTAAQDSVNQYNAMGAGLLKSVEGRLPQEEAERVFRQNYAMVPGLSDEQKAARRRAFQTHVRSMIGVKGKSAAGGVDAAGGTPTGFAEAGEP